MYEKPLPIVDPESAPYWSALKAKRLVLKRCRDCGRAHFYPRALCPHCHSDALEWSDARGTGSIYSFTVARRPAGPAFKADTPYVVAVVDLDEGARMMTNIVTDDVNAVRIGQRVSIVFDAVPDEITLPKFKPA
jgi:uncharacterized OB-fold protein